MAVSFIQKGGFVSSSLTITCSIASATAGNRLLLAVHSVNQSITTPSGWTEVGTQTGTGSAGSAGGVRIGVFTQIAAGGEAKATVNDTGNLTTGIMLEFAGTVGTPLINVVATTVDEVATLSVSCALATTTRPAMVVNAIALDKDANDSDVLSGISNPTLTSLTEQHDQTVSTNTGGGLAIITGLLGAAGSTGSTKATGDSSTTHAYMTIALAEPDIVTATAATLLFTAGTAAFAQPQVLGATAGTLALAGGTAEVWRDLGVYLLADTGLVEVDGQVVLPGGLFDPEEDVSLAMSVLGTAGTLAFTAGTAAFAQPQVLGATAGTIAFAAGTAAFGQEQQVTASAGALALVASAAAVEQEGPAYLLADVGLVSSAVVVLLPGGLLLPLERAGPIALTATAAEIAFTAGSATFVFPQQVDASAGTITFAAPQSAVGAGVAVAGTAGTLVFVGVQGTAGDGVAITGTAGSVTFTGMQASVAQGAPAEVTATAAELLFTAGAATFVHPQRVDAAAADISLAGWAAAISHETRLDASPAELAFVAGTADIAQSVEIAAVAGTLVFAAGSAAVLQVTDITAVTAELALEAGHADLYVGPWQYARPGSDLTVASWIPSGAATLYECLDEEVASDADYIYTEVATIGVVGLAAVNDPLVHTGHTLMYRVRGNGASDLIVTLSQPSGTIATWTESLVPDWDVDLEHTLTDAEAASIDDYGDLRVTLEAA